LEEQSLTPWPESASELYGPSDCRLSAKLVATFVDRCHVVSVARPYSRILGFLDRSRYLFFQVALQLYSRGWVDTVQNNHAIVKCVRCLSFAVERIWPIIIPHASPVGTTYILCWILNHFPTASISKQLSYNKGFMAAKITLILPLVTLSSESLRQSTCFLLAHIFIAAFNRSASIYLINFYIFHRKNQTVFLL
jgi:hypothetical protein